MKTVILCGGSGTRLWPISRKTAPKQFAKIIDDQSLYEKTIERNESFSDEIMVIVNERQFPLCHKQSKSNCELSFLLEPVGRNTAPAIALACLHAKPDDILMIVPSDHLIGDQKTYNDCVLMASELAKAGNLVTFGIKARYPETGYGYIEADGNNVVSFKEKPDKSTAIQYVASGNYFWNSGMFCFQAKTFLEELQKYSPETLEATKKVYENKKVDNEAYRFDMDLMLNIPDDSIDYAVMEKSDKVKVVPSPFNWSDMGSFDSLYEEVTKDEAGNNSNENHIAFESTNNLILSGHKRVIATFNVSDLVIVDTEDALLIGKKGKTQHVKEIVNKLKNSKPELLD
jgi:mannose-1-phosphate guanylyltransferase